MNHREREILGRLAKLASGNLGYDLLPTSPTPRVGLLSRL